MSDFHQGGPVCTLQRLRDRPAEELADEMMESRQRIALVIPCHARDLQSEALSDIAQHVSNAHYISEVILSVNGASPSEATHAVRAMPGGGALRLLWNDAPKLKQTLREAGVTAAECQGKGLNVWFGIGDVLARQSADVIVVHDADILNYNQELLVRLTYPVVHPGLGYKFAKGYYHRAADRLYGRLTRLFFVPLLEAMIHVAGHLPLFDFLSAFRYPLSGEFSGTSELLSATQVATGYGVETQLLCEMFRTAGENECCQVDIGPNYEHRHHPLADESGRGLQAMCGEIAAALLASAKIEGIRVDRPFLDALRIAYGNAARECLRRSRHVAQMNGFEAVGREEEKAVSLFAHALDAIKEAQTPPPLLPAWATLRTTAPDLADRILDIRAA